jgi:hypothetical protein
VPSLRYKYHPVRNLDKLTRRCFGDASPKVTPTLAFLPTPASHLDPGSDHCAFCVCARLPSISMTRPRRLRHFQPSFLVCCVSFSVLTHGFHICEPPRCGQNSFFSWRWCRRSFIHWHRRTKFKMPTRLNRATWIIIICILQLLDRQSLGYCGRTFTVATRKNGTQNHWFIRLPDNRNWSSSHLR